MYCYAFFFTVYFALLKILTAGDFFGNCCCHQAVPDCTADNIIMPSPTLLKWWNCFFDCLFKAFVLG